MTSIANTAGIEPVFLALQWLQIIGLGCLWLGGQIAWVAPLPRQLRRGETPTAPKGSTAAFGLFWIDQYGWTGLALCAAGLLLLASGWIGTP